KREPGTLRPRIVSVRDMLVPPIWNLLADAGIPTGLINVPVSYPPPERASFAISDFITPSTAPRFTHPPTLFDELRPLLGEYVIDPPPLESPGGTEAHHMLEGVEHLTLQQARYAEHLMKTREWGFCMVVFQATDWLQHRMWDALSGEYQIYPETPEILALRERAEKLLSALDAWIGRLLAASPPHTDVFIVSDHGFGPLRQRVKINQWLARHGLLALSRHRRLRGLLGRLDFLRLRHRINRILPRPRGGGKSAPPIWRRIDWRRTRAYAATRSDMGVHVNLRGREPQGIVSPDEYEEVRDAVLSAMKELRHPETGEPILTSAFRREDLFEGPGLEKAPDLIFILDGGACNHELRLDGPLFESTTSGTWTGTHRLDGVLIAHGPRIQRAQRLDQVDIIDVAPAVLQLFGLPVPDHTEGRIPDGLLTPEAASAAAWRQPHPPDDDDRGAGVPPESEYTEDETRGVEERLRDLGYL
ncbi:MAG: alkaline phosphatase family protein, partial [Armatimonadota bacterium]